MMMGGRAAEEAEFGKENISTGASNDWEKVNKLMKNAVETAVLYPELFGQVAILPGQNALGDSDASPELRAKSEQVRNQLLSYLYQVTLAFVNAIPPEARQKILETIEERETINDPNEIRQLFETSGVKSWKALWQQAQATRGKAQQGS